MALRFLCFLAIASAATAQQTVWGQCGGIGWTGATTCVSSSVCVQQNPYYYQCLPSNQVTTTTSTTTVTSTKTTTTSSASSTSTAAVNYWFSFGDSYSQTGFNVTTGPLPTIGNPLGNPPYPGWTATGGENYVDYLTTTYNSSLVLNYNFAYGGATINATLVPPFTTGILSLVDQVNEFMASVANKPASAPWTSANSLFSVWIGINDIGNSFYLSGDRGAFDDTLLDNYFQLVQQFYNVGARNFLFLNVPPIDRSPLMLAQPSSSQALEKSVIADYNSKLASRVASFQSANAGVTTWLWDSNSAFTTILDDPTAYGFADATSYGSDPTDFWGNNYHPSSYAHKFLSQDIAGLMNDTLWFL